MHKAAQMPSARRRQRATGTVAIPGRWEKVENGAWKGGRRLVFLKNGCAQLHVFTRIYTLLHKVSRSHLTNTRSGVWDKEKRDKMKTAMGRKQTRAADLCTGYFVARRSKPHFGDSSSSRRVASPNLWPRHLLLFVRCLPAVTLRAGAAGRGAPAPPPDAGISGRRRYEMVDFYRIATGFSRICGRVSRLFPHLPASSRLFPPFPG